MIRFLQIACTLNFNDKTDLDGLSMDSLHKIHSMLETLKRAIGYTDFGSEFSFNEATVACFSHYANLFHDANSEELKRYQSCTAFCEYCQ
jgi:hypothetical protein